MRRGLTSNLPNVTIMQSFHDSETGWAGLRGDTAKTPEVNRNHRAAAGAGAQRPHSTRAAQIASPVVGGSHPAWPPRLPDTESAREVGKAGAAQAAAARAGHCTAEEWTREALRTGDASHKLTLLTLPGLALAFSLLSLPCPALPCPALLCLALTCPALPCLALPCPALLCSALLSSPALLCFTPSLWLCSSALPLL